MLTGLNIPKLISAIKKTQLWRHVPKVMGKELISSKLTYDDLMSYYYFIYNIYLHDDYSLHKLPSLSLLY